MYSTHVNQINEENKYGTESETTSDNENPQVFIWGKAIPKNMFDQNKDQLTPHNCDKLTSQQIYNVTTAREGSHCFGIGKNDWLFAWGDTQQVGALGLGSLSCSTSPFLIRSLSKKNVIEIACSSMHGLCITNDMIIYGWGNRLLTLLPNNSLMPKQLNYLNNKGLNKLIASNTHSLAYNNKSLNVYSFGLNGPWLGLNNEQQIFGTMQFNIPYNNNVQLCVSHVSCSSEYTIIVLNTGLVGCCGINKHGRMGLGESIKKSSQILWNNNLRNIIYCSSGSFHSGYIDIYGNVYTCGFGNNYRHGHSHVNTIWIPQIIIIHDQSLNKFKFNSIECVEERTYIITNNGNLIMFGKEPITGRIHSKPFIFNYLNAYKIHKICGAKDFVVAIGYNRKNIIKTNMSNESVDSMKPNQIMDSTNQLIGDVFNNYYFNNGSHVADVYGTVVRSKQVKYTNNNASMPINNGNKNVTEVFDNFIGVKQVNNNNNNNNNNCPPINVVFGGMNMPPPPQLPNTQNQSFVYNDCVPKEDSF